MKKLSRQDVHDMLLGAAIVGTGGGGSLKEGLRIVDAAMDEGLEFILAQPNEIPDDALVGSPYCCGSIGYLTEDQQHKYDALPKIDMTPEVAAVRALEKYIGREFYGLVATELGGGNTAAALNAAARLGKPIIDADPAGRSVPCLQHSTLYLNGVSIAPMGLADIFGDTLIIPEVSSDERAEALARAAAVGSFNSIGVVDHPGEWRQMKNALIKNTLTYCLDIGRTARVAQQAGRCYALDVASGFRGYIMFDGCIERATWEDRDGFTFGDITVVGANEYEGDELRIWFQNEYIMSWKNGEVFVTAPDCINIVNKDTNMPLINPDAQSGMEVTVFALRAFEEWRTEKAVEVLGPDFFGYDIKYRKVEDILG